MNPENLFYVPAMLQRIFEHPWFKLWAGLTLFSLHFFFDSLNTTAIVSVFVLILMDSCTGLLAAYRTGVPIQSHKLLRTAIKVAVYFLLISAGYVSEHALPHVNFVDETIIGALALTELFSILENVARAGFTIAAKILTKLTKEITP